MTEQPAPQGHFQNLSGPSAASPPSHPGTIGAYAGTSSPRELPVYASWISRVGGALVDYLLILPGYVVMGFGGHFLDSSPDASASGLVGWGLAFLGVALWLGVVIWNQFIRQGRTGWSVGKQVVGIRLLSARTGQPIGAGMAFVRQLAHILDTLVCYLGWLWPLWDRKRQTLGDKVMSTVVVNQRKAPPSSGG